MTVEVGRQVATVAGLFVGGPLAMVGSEPQGPAAPAVDEDGGRGSGPWVSAIAKGRVDEPLFLGEINFVGDDQADRRVHGGPDKAVCVYPEAHYARWWAETEWPPELGPDRFGPGAFGENICVSAPMTEDVVCIGDTFRVGEATVQVSQPRSPCWKLGRRWGYPDLTHRTRDTDRTGWYLRVLETGVVAPSAPIVLLDRPYPEWSITETNRVMVHDRDDVDAARRLAACPALAPEWADPLRARVGRADRRA